MIPIGTHLVRDTEDEMGMNGAAADVEGEFSGWNGRTPLNNPEAEAEVEVDPV